MVAIPLVVRLYVQAVVLAAVGLIIWLGPMAPWTSPGFWIIGTAVVVLRVVAQFHPVELSHTTKVNVCAAIDVALFTILGGAATAVVAPAAIVGGVLLTLRRAYPWFNSVFNAGNYLLATAAGGLAIQLLRPPDAPLTSLAGGLAIVVGGLAYFVVNVGLVATAVGLSNQQENLGTWLAKFVHAAPQQFALIALGALTAIVFAIAPVAAALLLVPLGVLHYTQKSSLAIRADTSRVLESLASMVDQRDPYTARHSQRVAVYVAGICRHLKLPPDQADLIVRTARIHDIGKLGIAASVLNKPGRLDPQEWAEVKQHPVLGANMVSDFADYCSGKDFILHHHECLDGSGYPFGLNGAQIPLGARLIAVADAFDAMTTDRPYRRALSFETAAAELRRCAVSQFDPLVVDAFLQVFTPESWQLPDLVGETPLPSAAST